MSDSGKGKPLKFPDFTITYIGKTPYRFNGMEKYDFSVRSPQQMKKVAWIKSGIFVPTTFQIDGKHFLLEVDTSEKIRGVQPGEMVITHK